MRYGWDYGRDGDDRGPWRWESRGPAGGTRYDRDRGFGRSRVDAYDEGYRFGAGRGRSSGMGRDPRYGGDYWWLGEHYQRSLGHSQGYDRGYADARFADRPRYSPVGGMYHAMGGSYLQRRAPHQLRDPRWFSEWTRWF